MLSRLLVTLSVVVSAAGCVTVPYQPYAREAKKKPGVSGVIAMKTERRPEDEAHAQSLMKKNCGEKAVQVDEEGEVVVGEKSESSASKTRGERNDTAFALGGVSFGSRKPSEDTQTSTSTTQVKEWQITYTCK